MPKPFITMTVFVAGVLAFAETGMAASIQIDDAWSPAQTDTSKPGAVFLRISNEGTETDTLVSIETPVDTSVAAPHEPGEQGRSRAEVRNFIKGVNAVNASPTSSMNSGVRASAGSTRWVA